MEPRIQYAQTKDGVRIAFSALGEGTTLVQMWTPTTTLQQWQVPEFRAWSERLAQKRMLVNYDHRGTGLSQRDVTDFSIEALGLDVSAVADRLGLERFALWANITMGPVAIAYAARHPERVSQLILWCSFARGSDLLRSPQVQALERLLTDNWELYTVTLAHYAFGWTGGEAARVYAATIREGIKHETLRVFQDQLFTADVTHLLSQVRAPTLVLHRRQFRLVSVDAATELASRIPNARLVPLNGAVNFPALGDTQSIIDAVDGFLAESEEEASTSLVDEPPAAAALRTILFTDVEGSTALTQRLGDAKARELLREHERMVREALKAHGGSEVKTLGDGFMASFSSATKALECSIAVQRAFAEHNESAEEPIKVRVGLNAGEPIAEEDDLYGTAVIEAARITAAAQGGEILVANVVRELAKGKDFLFADRGETSLRGFEDPVRLFEVRWSESD